MLCPYFGRPSPSSASGLWSIVIRQSQMMDGRQHYAVRRPSSIAHYLLNVWWLSRRSVGSNIVVLGFPEEYRADDKADTCDGHRVPQAGEVIAGAGDQAQADDRYQSAEDAVADMVGQRHRGIADAGREQLDQEGRDRT